MSMRKDMQSFDREQAYIRSQTSVADIEFSHPQATSQQRGCIDGIFDDIIENLSGEVFKKAMDAVTGIEAILNQSQPGQFEEVKSLFAALTAADEKLAQRMAECIRRQAGRDDNLKELAKFPEPVQAQSGPT